MVNPSVQTVGNNPYQDGVLGVIATIRNDSSQLINLNSEYKCLLGELESSDFVRTMKDILQQAKYN